MSPPATAFNLIKQILFAPSSYFERIENNRLPRGFPVAIFMAAIIAGSFFYAWKPAGFPQGSFSADAGSHGIGFWLLMGLLGFLLALIAAALCWAFFRFLDPQLKVRIGAIIAVTLSAHVYYIFLFGFLWLACLTQGEAFYKAAELVFSLASFVFIVSGLRSVARSSGPKAFLVVFLSSLVLLVILYGFYFKGLLPESVFRALLLV